MNKETFYEIAKLVDNDFIGSEKTFTYSRFIGYALLSTNRCDEASMIRVYTDRVTVFKIERNGPDTDGYESIQEFTKKKVRHFLDSINVKHSL